MKKMSKRKTFLLSTTILLYLTGAGFVHAANESTVDQIATQEATGDSSTTTTTSPIRQGNTDPVTGDDVWKYLNLGRMVKSDGSYEQIGENSLVLGGSNNIAINKNDIVIGGTNSQNIASENGVIIGGIQNTTVGENSTAVGGKTNTAYGSKTTTIGGSENNILGEFGTNVGGNKNYVDSEATLGSNVGGYNNCVFGQYSTSVGGTGAHVYDSYNTVVGGSVNSTLSGKYSTAVGGAGNKLGADFSVSIGGQNNQSSAVSKFSVVIGGKNLETTYNDYTTVVGGDTNRSYQKFGTVVGGYFNHVFAQANTSDTDTSGYSTIVGGNSNNINPLFESGFSNATVIGGKNTYVGSSNSVSIGGVSNTILANADGSTVIGTNNHVADNAQNSVIIGKQNYSAIANGVAIGNEATVSEAGTVSFGHASGDATYYYGTLNDKQKTSLTTELNEIHTAGETNYDGLKAKLTEYGYSTTSDAIKTAIEKDGYDSWAANTVNTIQVKHTTYDTDGYNRLVNIADGIGDHDAATLGQVKQLTASPLHVYTDGDDHSFFIFDDENSTSTGSGNIGIGNAITAKNYSTVLGSNSTATNYSTALGTNATANNYSLSLGSHTTATGKNSVSIGYDSYTTSDNTVSFGHTSTDTFNGTAYGSNLYRRLTNVANGTSAHDVATVGQLTDYRVGTGLKLSSDGTGDNGQSLKTINLDLDTSISLNSSSKKAASGWAVFNAFNQGRKTAWSSDKGYYYDEATFGKGSFAFGGEFNVVSGNYSVNVSGRSNTVSGYESGILSGESNTASGRTSGVLGGYSNTADGSWSTIIGGGKNATSGRNTVAGGGQNNTAGGASSVAIGGSGNTASGTGALLQFDCATVIGGNDNFIYGKYSSGFGGTRNSTYGQGSVTSGGISNMAFAENSASFGGNNGKIFGYRSTGVGGGSTSTSANYGVSLGNQSVVMNENGVALGYQSTQSETGTISFGHDKGDVSGFKYSWKTYSDGSTDYTSMPDVTTTTYTNSYYNRLVKIADGINDHDATTLGQVKKLVSDSVSEAAYTAGSDIIISDDHTISVSKAGKIASGDTGLVTGDTVYSVTSKLAQNITEQETAISSMNSKFSSMTTSIENIRKNVTDINNTVASTIADLSGTMGSFVSKDLTNISDDGRLVLKDLIKAELKNQTAQSVSNTSASTQELAMSLSPVVTKSIAEPLAVTEATPNLDALTEKLDTKADLSYVDDALSKKADKATVDAISAKVDTNTKNIAANTEAIKTNTENIKNLQETKADKDGSNIDVASWSEKLGTGTVSKDDKGLVTGNTVFSALEGKADLDYVNSGFTGLSNQMQLMNQNLTKDINNGVAAASALAALKPLDYDSSDKFNFAVGYGHYKNANSTALGAFYYANADTMFNFGATIGNGTPALNAGLSFKLGKGSSYAGVSKADLVKDNMSLHQEVAQQTQTIMDQQEQLDKQSQKIENQDKKIDELEKLIKTLINNQGR